MTEIELKEMIMKELKLIAPESDPAALPADQNIREALDIDSYDFLQFLIAISDRTGVEIPESEYRNVFTLAGLMRYLQKKR